MPSSRRSFLAGRFHAAAHELRPPWALPAGAFEDRCTRCDRCAQACTARIVVRGAGGFPTIDFTRGGCSFCGDCARVCEPGALRRSDAVPVRREATIGDGCLAARGVECRICGECCDAGAIAFRPRVGGVARPQLDASACTGCGACVAPCPVAAIQITNEAENGQ